MKDVEELHVKVSSTWMIESSSFQYYLICYYLACFRILHPDAILSYDTDIHVSFFPLSRESKT